MREKEKKKGDLLLSQERFQKEKREKKKRFTSADGRSPVFMDPAVKHRQAIKKKVRTDVKYSSCVTLWHLQHTSAPDTDQTGRSARGRLTGINRPVHIWEE